MFDTQKAFRFSSKEKKCSTNGYMVLNVNSENIGLKKNSKIVNSSPGF